MVYIKNGLFDNFNMNFINKKEDLINYFNLGSKLKVDLRIGDFETTTIRAKKDG